MTADTWMAFGVGGVGLGLYTVSRFRHWACNSHLLDQAEFQVCCGQLLFSSNTRYMLAAAAFWASHCVLLGLLSQAALALGASSMIVAVVVGLLVQTLVLPVLPGIDHLVDRWTYAFQRLAFFPEMPTEREERLLMALIAHPESFQPLGSSLEQEFPDGVACWLHSATDADLQRLALICCALRKRLDATNWFPGCGALRELLAVVETKLRMSRSPPTAKQRDSLLFAVYLCTARWTLRAHWRRTTRERALSELGFIVDVAPAWPLRLYRRCLQAMRRRNLPQERRVAPRVRCYRPSTLRLNGGEWRNEQMILSPNGACIPTHCRADVGSAAQLHVEGFGAVPVTVVRSEADKLCLAFPRDGAGMLLYLCVGPRSLEPAQRLAAFQF